MARQSKNVPAVAYLRTSSAANVGQDKDSDRRQRHAIEAFARLAGFTIVAEYYDAAVSGADRIEERPGFAELLDQIEGNGVRTVIVEDASRFARDVQAHVLGIALLRARGVRLLASNGDNLTDDTDEMTEGMLTIAAVFSQIEKKRLVRKLRVARERKRASGVKVEGRRSHAELNPEMVAMARQLRRKRPKGGQRSLREISRELAQRGHINQRGAPFSAMSVRSMLA
ncbi:MAG: recombinase family protein [Beijerinckiaceae bacterium]